MFCHHLKCLKGKQSSETRGGAESIPDERGSKPTLFGRGVVREVVAVPSSLRSPLPVCVLSVNFRNSCANQMADILRKHFWGGGPLRYECPSYFMKSKALTRCLHCADCFESPPKYTGAEHFTGIQRPAGGHCPLRQPEMPHPELKQAKWRPFLVRKVVRIHLVFVLQGLGAPDLSKFLSLTCYVSFETTWWVFSLCPTERSSSSQWWRLAANGPKWSSAECFSEHQIDSAATAAAAEWYLAFACPCSVKCVSSEWNFYCGTLSDKAQCTVESHIPCKR